MTLMAVAMHGALIAPRPRMRVRVSLTVVTGAMCAVLLLLNVGLYVAELVEHAADLSPLAITAVYSYMVVGFLIPQWMHPVERQPR